MVVVCVQVRVSLPVGVGHRMFWVHCCAGCRCVGPYQSRSTDVEPSYLSYTLSGRVEVCTISARTATRNENFGARAAPSVPNHRLPAGYHPATFCVRESPHQ